MADGDLDEALQAYHDEFDDLPTIIGLDLDDPEMAGKVVTVLSEAVAAGEAFETDAAWYAALGIDAPPEDAVV